MRGIASYEFDDVAIPELGLEGDELAVHFGALEVVANFARSAGLEWGGGLGIGSGGMLAGLASVPPGAGIKRSVSEGLDWIAGLAARGEASGETRFVRFAFPRFAYILAAHAGWKAMARANGLRPRDIGNPRRTR